MQSIPSITSRSQSMLLRAWPASRSLRRSVSRRGSSIVSVIWIPLQSFHLPISHGRTCLPRLPTTTAKPRPTLPSTRSSFDGAPTSRKAGSPPPSKWPNSKENRPDGLAVVIIISDGRADRGLRRTEELAQYGAELRARGISTATVAVGAECDLSLLLAVDPDGFHGQFAVAVGEGAVDTLVANRLELLTEIAEEVQVSVTCPPQARITVLGTIPSERSGDRLMCTLSNMRASSRRAVVLKAILPAAEVGETADFGVELSWMDMSGEPRRLGPVTRTQTFVRGKDNTPQKRDLDATMVVLMQWRLKLLRDLIALNRQGRLREAEAELAREMKFFDRYAHGIPEAASLLTELRLALPAVHRPWREKASAALARRPRTVPGG